MESFTLFRQHLAKSGIILQQHSHPFNFKNVTILTLLGVNMVLLYKQLEESEAFEEYADIVYRLLFMFSFDVIFLTFVIKSLELFKFIGDLEDTINHRKCKTILKFPKHSIRFQASQERARKCRKWKCFFPTFLDKETLNACLTSILFRRTQTGSRTRNTLHRNKSTHQEMDWNVAFHHFDGGTAIICTPDIHIKHCRLLRNWTGKRGSSATSSSMVMNVARFYSSLSFNYHLTKFLGFHLKRTQWWDIPLLAFCFTYFRFLEWSL